ncbi:alpha/beta fold hydrolase [Streptomyces sp. NPDC059452]|uniref:alpha/beta fold hydrolase n=1 Tax=Streptomyces sp. NPDC059452 TaxID=3346835 RepID=UPI0036828BF8
MSTFTTTDGTTIFYKDWGTGRPVVFSHAWPLNADVWDNQLRLLAEHGYRAIAHDRRGHGRSDQPWQGNDMDTYADDLAQLVEHLGLADAVLVGHSIGGSEVVRYLGRYGTGRVARAVLLGAAPSLTLRTDADPDGPDREALDGLRRELGTDRSQLYRDLSEEFYGTDDVEATVSQGLRDAFWLMGMAVGGKAAYDFVEQFWETDFTEDLRRIRIPVLVAHGDEDHFVPVGAAHRSVQLLPNATLKVYPGAPHGLSGAFEEEFTADLLDFVKR